MSLQLRSTMLSGIGRSWGGGLASIYLPQQAAERALLRPAIAHEALLKSVRSVRFNQD